jgi:hypothetical protein
VEMFISVVFPLRWWAERIPPIRRVGHRSLAESTRHSLHQTPSNTLVQVKSHWVDHETSCYTFPYVPNKDTQIRSVTVIRISKVSGKISGRCTSRIAGLV